MKPSRFLARSGLAGLMLGAILLAPAAAQEERPIAAQAQIMQTAKQSPQAQGTPTRGAIISLYVNDQASNDFAKFRGILTLDFVGTGAMEYKWGGSTCPGRDVSAQNLQILVAAMTSKLKVTPETKPGQGGAQCLVGFTISG